MALKIDAAESGRIITVMTMIIASFFLLDLLFIYLSRTTYNNGLASNIDDVLNSGVSNDNEKYFVGDRVQIKSMLDTSCAIYKVQSATDKESSYVAVARITTSAGPFPAIFLCSNDGVVKFVTFMNVPSAAKNMLSSIAQSQITYWTNQVKKMLGGLAWQN